MIDKQEAKRILDTFGVCTIRGGYGMGLCAMAGAFDARPLMGIWQDSEIPSDRELEQLRSYQEYSIRSRYTETWIRKLLEMKPPVDEGANTLVVRKGSGGDPGRWAYRRITWETGPAFLDRSQDGTPFLSVEEMLDSVVSLVPDRFRRWKEAHPEIFGKKATVCTSCGDAAGPIVVSTTNPDGSVYALCADCDRRFAMARIHERGKSD